MNAHIASILERISDRAFAIGFFALVTLELVAGYFVWDSSYGALWLNVLDVILIFGGLIILGIGYRLDGRKSHPITMVGWVVFAAYWAMQPANLYWSEGGDIVNALFCIIGVYILMYLAYQEFGLYYTGSENPNMRWMAGASFIIGWIYFVIEKVPSIASALIYSVAQQTVWVLNAFGLPAYIQPGETMWNSVNGCNVLYPGFDGAITIILACTGIQSMAIFIGAIACLQPGASAKKLKGSLHVRKWHGFLATVPVIYVLNLLRNTLIIWLVCDLKWDFGLAHNVVGKGGALGALIIIAFIIFELLPELYDTIYGLFALPRENGPIERTLGTYKGPRI